MLRNALLIVLIFLTSSCVTRSLLEDSSYTEDIEFFMITKGSDSLIIIGEDHHYIFDIDEELKKILLSDSRPKLIPYFRGFRVELDNIIAGNYSLTNETDPTPLQAQWFLDHDFSLTNTAQQYRYEGKLTGTRYLANKKINNLYQFEKQYSIEITEDDSTAEKAGKILLTPITISADGVLVIAGTAIVATLFTVGYTAAKLTGNCKSDWC